MNLSSPQKANLAGSVGCQHSFKAALTGIVWTHFSCVLVSSWPIFTVLSIVFGFVLIRWTASGILGNLLTSYAPDEAAIARPFQIIRFVVQYVGKIFACVSFEVGHRPFLDAYRRKIDIIDTSNLSFSRALSSKSPRPAILPLFRLLVTTGMPTFSQCCFAFNCFPVRVVFPP